MSPEILAAAVPERRDELAAILAKHVETTEYGRVLIKDASGSVRYLSDQPGCPEMPVSDFVDELRRTKPELFGSAHAKAEDKASAVPAKTGQMNPMRFGSTFAPPAADSLTARMAAAKSNPAALAALRADLGLKA